MDKNVRPTTQVLLKHKEYQSTVEFANMLEKIAQKLKNEGKFTFVQGTEQIEVTPADQIKVEYKYTKKGDKYEFEIEFDWRTGDHAPKTMGIE